ncbi:hypothetical protein ACIRP5_10990 [Streptomyces sp. NPDC101221]|uniref:hypothetical protein n=1 Tax=Streptomyces sp. NPDC101221 TaxID=3366132 RepID=UPI003802BA33
MSEAWGMIAAAILAGAFTLTAGVIAYRAGRRQVADQGLIEHRHWQRQNRLDAYQRVLTTSDRFARAMDLWGRIETRESANLAQALEEVVAAEAGVRLVGPDSMYTPLKAVTNAAGNALRRTGGVRRGTVTLTTAQWAQLTQDLIAATNRFVTAAAAVLTNPDE